MAKQLFKYMFSVKEGESRFSVVWHQTVNSVGNIGGLGSFSQHNASSAYHKTACRRKTHGAGMKARIFALNKNYNLKQIKA